MTPPYSCFDCKKAHRHSDGAVFCSVLSARLTEDSRPPENCQYGSERKGKMRKAILIRPKKDTILEWY